MPIQGLTDPDSLIPRFPRLGKLRKGDIKTDPKKPGTDLEYFRFTSDRPEITDAFSAVYGNQPKAINVFLPFITLNENFQTWKEAWKAGGLQHRCDGKTMVLWLEGGKFHTDPRPCPGGCTEIGRLTMVIPELIQAGFIGYVTLDTGSTNDILAIARALRAMWESRRHNPNGLRGVPYILRRVPEMVSTPGWGENKDSKVRTKKFLVKLDPPPDWVRTELAIDDRAAIEPGKPRVSVMASGQKPALPSGVQTETISDAPEEPDLFTSADASEDAGFPETANDSTESAPAMETVPVKAKSAGEETLEKERKFDADVNLKAVKAAERYVTGKGTSFAKLTNAQCLELINFYRNAKKEKGALIQVDEDKYHACLTLYRVKFGQEIPPE